MTGRTPPDGAGKTAGGAPPVVVGYVGGGSAGSSPGDDLHDLRMQRAAVAQAASARGWAVQRVIEADRPAAQGRARAEALTVMAAAPGGVLLVAALPGLAPSLLEAAAVFASAREEGWHLVAIDPPLDTTRPGGAFVADLVAAAAASERALISRHTKEALASSRTRGVRLGRPSETPDSTLRLAMTLRDAGLSLRAVALELRRRGVASARGGNWHPNTVKHLLESQQAQRLRTEKAPGD